MTTTIAVRDLTKTYASGFKALDGVDLDVAQGEIFALLGSNGAGKSTLINIICGLVRASSGTVKVQDMDIRQKWREVRSLIGLVPQELHTDSFETVSATVAFSRGVFGKPRRPDVVEKVLRDLSLYDKRDQKIIALSGGMKRRVMIAKALAHEPRILFLDEPTAGVDVELRRDMWELVRGLKAEGVTIILTTHYIEEAEELADRVAVINHGKILLVEEKTALMRRLGSKRLTLHLAKPLSALPTDLDAFDLALSEEGKELTYTFEARSEGEGVAALIRQLSDRGIEFSDLQTRQSSLEDIFVSLVSPRR